ncbi:hypothetical protein OCU04_002375 [Sclerotinia nivalis]|uniref:Uncharacterized protein n=1 Tax=Sclerotinia nivalis TaxID=352851 RepID=A0A9X0ATH5_9HELO|nr:hypothetical protein OCU04_002375 [Sclerotinia nivalis]
MLSRSETKGRSTNYQMGFGYAAADYFNLCIQRVGTPVYNIEEDDSDDETVDSQTVYERVEDRWEDHDAVSYNEDLAKVQYHSGWNQLVLNWKLATFTYRNLNRISKDAGRLPATELFDHGRVMDRDVRGQVYGSAAERPDL